MNLDTLIDPAALPRSLSAPEASPEREREREPERQRIQGRATPAAGVEAPGHHDAHGHLGHHGHGDHQDHDHTRAHAHAHTHAHAHAPHAARPSAVDRAPQRETASLLMQSASVRVALAGGLVALLWAAVGWSLSGSL